MSNLGTNCDRKLWYEINTPEKAEPLLPSLKFKFLKGHLWEDILKFFVREAGHDVRYDQKEVKIDGVKGHIDAVIDGVVVDIKSTSSLQYAKFKNGLTQVLDIFGYLTQLGAYHFALRREVPVLVDPERKAFLVVDKQHGKIHVDIHEKDDIDYEQLVKDKRETLQLKDPPPRAYEDLPDGKSGNRRLGTECSYCPYKHTCWSPLRTFLYSNKPRFLTKVEREPNVPEITGAKEIIS